MSDTGGGKESQVQTAHCAERSAGIIQKEAGPVLAGMVPSLLDPALSLRRDGAVHTVGNRDPQQGTGLGSKEEAGIGAGVFQHPRIPCGNFREICFYSSSPVGFSNMALPKKKKIGLGK